MPWLGAIALSADAKGLVGAQQDVQVNGVVSRVEVMDQVIRIFHLRERFKVNI